jgi:hypothetical protein
MNGPALTEPIADRHQRLQMFFSADLSGGTAFKNQYPVERIGYAQAWPTVFEQFFREFERAFRDRVTAAREEESDDAWIAPPPQLWKINGDELLFTELVYPDLRRRNPALSTSLLAFVELVKKYDEIYLAKGLGVRGCIWTAGFPLRNKALRIADSDIAILKRDLDLQGDQDGGGFAPGTVAVADYVGRDMDLGFRLAALAPPKRVVCSFDVAQFVTALPDASRLAVYHVGWQPLKGILRGLPYPILWLESGDTPHPRHPWETSPDHSSAEVTALLRGDVRLTKARFDELANELDGQFPEHMIRAYPSSTEMSIDHRVTWTANQPLDPTQEIAIDEAGKADLAAWADEIATITLDDLNQILLLLQENPDRAAELRAILLEVADHESYAAWEDKYEFHGKLFRLHRSLAFANDDQRRLLEGLRLVQKDVLRVKLHARGSGVFMTDGLWVSPSIRVFPFADESDLVMRACAEQGWMDWATCVIDPAVGCGHNLLRYEGSGVRRYGFDRSARAVAYAAINTVLNDVAQTTVGVSDIRRGIRPVFTTAEAERVLVVANMPFALVPNPDTIARSTDGGRYGYRLTLDVLEAVDALADALDERSELRCVVLAYSVGSKQNDKWVVPDETYERFGKRTAPLSGDDDGVGAAWHVWRDEKLWRINGKKEQTNPMPLERLELKADCRFYVREDARRDAVRADYRGLTEELAKLGHDHLAYGAVVVRHPRRAGVAWTM